MTDLQTRLANLRHCGPFPSGHYFSVECSWDDHEACSVDGTRRGYAGATCACPAHKPEGSER